MDPLSADKKVISYIIQAQEEELKRIAHELHEGVAQTLYSTITGLYFIENGLDKPEIKNYTNELITQLTRTLNELRWLSTELYPPTLDTLGLMSALKAYIKIFTSTFGIEVSIQSIGEERKLTSIHEVTLLRVCQEIMYNSAKYADTTQIDIIFSWLADELKIEIKDYGAGFDVCATLKNKELLGIPAMKQRMELIHGTFQIDSEIGIGTQVEISLPSM